MVERVWLQLWTSTWRKSRQPSNSSTETGVQRSTLNHTHHFFLMHIDQAYLLSVGWPVVPPLASYNLGYFSLLHTPAIVKVFRMVVLSVLSPKCLLKVRKG